MFQKRIRAQIALVLFLAVLLTVNGVQTATAQPAKCTSYQSNCY